MLVLSRKVGESIHVGCYVVVVVVGATAGRVRLGFEAPKDVRIVRDELLVGEDTVLEEYDGDWPPGAPVYR